MNRIENYKNVTDFTIQETKIPQPTSISFIEPTSLIHEESYLNEKSMIEKGLQDLLNFSDSISIDTPESNEPEDILLDCEESETILLRPRRNTIDEFSYQEISAVQEALSLLKVNFNSTHAKQKSLDLLEEMLEILNNDFSVNTLNSYTIKELDSLENALSNLNENTLRSSFLKCYDACIKGKLSEVKKLINRNPELTRVFYNEEGTLFHAAAISNQLNILKWLHAKNSKGLEQIRPSDGKIPLHVAAEQGYLDMFKWLNEQGNFIEVKDKMGLTPLHLAALNEKIDILTVGVSELKDSFLCEIAGKKNCPKSIQFLFDKNILPGLNYRSKALHMAAGAGLNDNVICLLNNKIDVNAQDDQYATPIFLAAKKHLSTVQLLIKRGASLSYVNKQKGSLLHIATLAKNIQILEELLKNDACKDFINSQDNNGDTPLHYVCRQSEKIPFLSLLIQYGANPRIKNIYGDTPLHLTSKKGAHEKAQILLANQNQKGLEDLNKKNQLPFDLAVMYQQDKFIEFFLKNSHDNAKKIVSLLKEQDLLERAKAVNYALTLLNKNDILFERYLIKKLKLIEDLYISSLKSDTIQRRKSSSLKEFEFKDLLSRSKHAESNPILFPQKSDKRQLLQDIRKIALKNEKNVQAKITESFQQLFGILIKESEELFKETFQIQLPKWACLGIGATARGEMFPYSKIECIFLIEKMDKLSVFQNFFKILEIKIINLGESKTNLHLESGFDMEFLKVNTPHDLAVTMENLIFSKDLNAFCCLAGDKTLISAYQKEKKKLQNKAELAKGLLHNYPRLSSELPKNNINIKKGLFNPFNDLIESFSLWNNIEKINIFEKIDMLTMNGIFICDLAEALKKAIEKTISLCIKAHLHYKSECEIAIYDKENDVYCLGDEVVDLKDIYQVLKKFHQFALFYFEGK